MDTTPDEPLDQFGDSKPIDALNSHEESPAESPLVVSGGRRRGRRKVMKKKMLKDDEGYLGMSPPRSTSLFHDTTI